VTAFSRNLRNLMAVGESLFWCSEGKRFMFCSRSRRSPRQQANEYATQGDFQKIFSEDMAGLHLLAYLLTADSDMAEQIFVDGLEDSIHGNPVFRQWARSWSQRAIIKRAIKAVAPSSNEPRSAPISVQPHTGKPDLDLLVQAIGKLATFERFVFVLSVLEGYSVSECATLLACILQDVVSARAAALKRVAAAQQAELVMPQPPVAVWKSLFTSAQAS
jgi:DNA-directed RNA polymerase specialized sigma24 family protein